MVPHIAAWTALAVVVLALAIWRQLIGFHEDDSLHLREGEAGLVKDQASLVRKLSAIDRAGKILTVIAVAYGLAIGGWAVYQHWIDSTKL